MTDQRLQELVTQALDSSLFESIQPSVKVEAGGDAGRVEIPLVFAKHFASLVLKERA
jgi:hypothetical protein